MPANTTETLTIREMAAQCGLSEHTLRYYERIGLLTPIPRDRSSGHRRYAPETVGLIESLSCLRRSGLSIQEMRAYLRLRAQGDGAASQQKALFQAHLQVLARDMEQLQVRQCYLQGKVAYWAALERGDTEKAGEIAQDNAKIAKQMK